MARLVVAIDRSAGLSPADMAAAWDMDDEARRAGSAVVEVPRPGEFLGDVLALVVIPLGVNLASSAACALVSRVVARLRPPGGEPTVSNVLEVVASGGGSSDLTVVVRLGRPKR